MMHRVTWKETQKQVGKSQCHWDDGLTQSRVAVDRGLALWPILVWDPWGRNVDLQDHHEISQASPQNTARWHWVKITQEKRKPLFLVDPKENGDDSCTQGH